MLDSDESLPTPGTPPWLCCVVLRTLYIPFWETETKTKGQKSYPCNIGPLGVSSTQNSFYSAYWSPKIQSWPDVAKARTLLLLFGFCPLLAHKSIWSSLRGKLRPGEEPWNFQVTGQISLSPGALLCSLPSHPNKVSKVLPNGHHWPCVDHKRSLKVYH